jgi:hypothetical protein
MDLRKCIEIAQGRVDTVPAEQQSSMSIKSSRAMEILSG